MKNMTTCAATSSVLGFGRAMEAAGARRTAPPVHTVKGTGLPFAVLDATRLSAVGVVGVGMGPDQVQGTGVVRIRIAADPGIPPRRGPVRC